MKKNLLQRVIIIAVVTLVGLWIVVGPRHKPTPKDFTPAGFQNTLRENIHLGLDLRGGSHLVIQVQVPDYLHKLTDATANGVQQAAAQQGYDVKEVRPEVDEKNNTYRIVLVAGDASKVSDIRDQLPRKVNDFDPNTWASTASGNTITWEMTHRAKADLGARQVPADPPRAAVQGARGTDRGGAEPGQPQPASVVGRRREPRGR